MVVTWPKGYVSEPTWTTKIYYFFRDNGLVLWALLWLIVLILFIFVHGVLLDAPKGRGSLFRSFIHLKGCRRLI